jgi:L-fucose isomerase
MLFKTWLSGGNPPLFMDFRKVWEPWEIQKLARSLNISFTGEELWAREGIVDGNNSGSASFDWAGMPGDSVEKIMANVSMPGAEMYYFPGGGNSCAFITPGGIDCVAARMAYSQLSGLFSMVWDEACTVEMPAKLADAVANTSNVTWPHTWVVPKHATMAEYKQYAPANHFHAIWGLPTSRLQYWMDLANVLSVAPWARRPQWIEQSDRPLPLLYLLNGGENQTKLMRHRG